ncbi:MAG: ATP-binding protein [Motiliproteus sp.]
MHWLSQLKQYRRENPLAVRLLAYILLFSSLITLLSTALQLYLNYSNELSVIDDRIQQMEATSLGNLANDVWLINGSQIQTQLDDLYQLPDMHYLQLDTQFDERFSAGEPPPPNIPLIQRSYPLEHITPEGERYALGTLQININLQRVHRHLKEQILVILAAQGVKTFLVSIFILYLFWVLVTQHLGALSRYAGSLTLDHLDQPLQLKRRHQHDDELSQVVNAINGMRLSLMDDIDKRKQAERALAELNEQLEARVRQRTGELEQMNSELNRTLAQLRGTQAQLVESEKMAALGNLVAGVAHEINTPLGIGLTAATFLRDQAYAQQRAPAQQAQHAGDEFQALAIESCELITTNLQRAAQLISAFKQVSADQSSEQRRIFDLGDYLQEVVLSMAPRLKRSAPQIDISCPPGLILNSYPGAFYQILSNLILNSLIHGFAEQPGGRIWIEVNVTADAMQLTYRDNGVGIDAAVRARVFDPFFTTRRNLGCSGLGLHIAYNLASQILQGRLCCLAPDTEQAPGASFRIELPESHRHQG